ncbi:hypothetical protein G3T14_01525 [Methylobacterium sp. BTF04]|uniref:hypothetical protein n=1 Tax=Methylobacterium sp. BTF04 TaxID=2708300 RepID=UPI0013D54A68|nr:hypothetical protein [Methylobacterium sp. BTF04]NEU10812.1 hypothetical protein [Methylobacterium sp. BTF04]
MSNAGAPRNPAYDPFGEPMDVASVCANAKGYGESRKALLVFWALALIFLGGRIYLAAPQVDQTVARSVPAQVADLR